LSIDASVTGERESAWRINQFRLSVSAPGVRRYTKRRLRCAVREAGVRRSRRCRYTTKAATTGDRRNARDRRIEVDSGRSERRDDERRRTRGGDVRHARPDDVSAYLIRSRQPTSIFRDAVFARLVVPSEMINADRSINRLIDRGLLA